MGKGEIIDAHTVKVACELAGSAEDAWHHLTSAEGLAKWLAVSRAGIAEGGAVELLFDVKEVPERKNAGAVIDGSVSEFVPFRRLAYSWKDPSVDSKVAFDLAPAGGQVGLTVTHRDLPTRFVARCGAGWHTHLGILEDHLGGRAPRPFLETFEAVLPAYEAELASVLSR